MNIDKQFEVARLTLGDFMGSAPNGVLLAEKTDRVIALDASICQILDLQPHDVLGQKLKKVSEDLFLLPPEVIISQFKIDGSPYSIAKVNVEKGLAVGFWLGESVPQPEVRESSDHANEIDLLELLLSRSTQDELLAWLGELFDRHSNRQLGAIAIKQGAAMALWTSWPATELPILPLRFPAEHSTAFRTGRGGRASEETEATRIAGAFVEPLIVSGQVIGLIAWEGNQPMVKRLLASIPLALSRFAKLES